MFQRKNNKIVSIFLILISFATGLFIIQSNSFSERSPAATSDFTQADFDKATPAASIDDFSNSRPAAGRSYFDMIFSKKDSSGLQYDIPYPFNKIIARLEDYNGQKINQSQNLGPKVTIFPMGRSLQRDAAAMGLKPPVPYDLYFRFPRVVIGIDEEPKYENSLLLNLKNKFYMGFNEKAEILEVISYNDESGRFEYQVVKDYAAGKTPKVAYAHRMTCLGCHQNQTPIFSRGPWSESNANVQMSDELKKKLDATFGAVTCSESNDQSYCYKNGTTPHYFGAPVRVDQGVPYSFDVSTDEANLTHVYQKAWKEFCADKPCRQAFLEAMLLYRFSSMDGLIPDTAMQTAFRQIEQNWKAKYPNGISIASPNVPNRDPIKDVVTSSSLSAGKLSTVSGLAQHSIQDLLNQSKIPSEFEPLLPRLPIDIWKDSGIDSHQTNRLLRGLANEFTLADVKMIDQWLMKNKTQDQIVTELTSQCEIDNVGNDVAFTCEGNGPEGFSFDAYIPSQDGMAGWGKIAKFKIRSAKLNCDPSLSQNDQNRYTGKSCPEFTNLNVYYKKTGSAAGLFVQRIGGLSLRTLQGYYSAEVGVNLTTKQAVLKVYNQSNAMKDVIAKNQDELFKTPTFSRFQIMKTIMTAQQMMPVPRMQNWDMSGLGMQVDGEVAVETLNPNMDGPAVMRSVCAGCHKNNEGVPPNFMGLPLLATPYDQCRRIETCAPRLIYRLKMRNCAQADFGSKKNPMPPEFAVTKIFNDLKLPKDTWMKTYNGKILTFLYSLVSEAELAKSLTTHGLSAADAMTAAQDIMRSDCPKSNSVIYDQLPRCDFSNLSTLTRCHQ